MHPEPQEEFPAALAERIMKEAREQQEEIAAEGDPLRQADPDSVRRCRQAAASPSGIHPSSWRSVSAVTHAFWSAGTFCREYEMHPLRNQSSLDASRDALYPSLLGRNVPLDIAYLPIHLVSGGGGGGGGAHPMAPLHGRLGRSCSTMCVGMGVVQDCSGQHCGVHCEKRAVHRAHVCTYLTVHQVCPSALENGQKRNGAGRGRKD